MDVVKDIIKAAREQGWRVDERGDRGIVFYPPNKQFPAIRWAATPSDHRAWRNNLARLRRAGLIWPWPAT